MFRVKGSFLQPYSWCSFEVVFLLMLFQVVSHCWSTGPIGVKAFFKRGQQEVVWWQIEVWFQRKQYVSSRWRQLKAYRLRFAEYSLDDERVETMRTACAEGVDTERWTRESPTHYHTALPHWAATAAAVVAAPRRTQGEGGQGSRHDSPPRRPLILTTDWTTDKQNVFGMLVYT